MTRLWHFRSLQAKLTAAFLLFVLVPTAAVIFYSSRAAEAQVEAQAVKASRDVLTQADYTVTSRINSLINASSYLVLDPDVLEILSRLPADGAEARQDQADVEEGFTQIQISILDHRSLMTLVANDGRVFSSWRQQGRPVEYAWATSQDWYRRAREANGHLVWLAPHENYAPQLDVGRGPMISLARLVKGNRGQGGHGVLLISTYLEDLRRELGANGDLTLLNESGTLIAGPRSPIGAEELDRILKGDDGSFRFTALDREYIVHYATVNRSEWKLMRVLSAEELLRPIQAMRNRSLLITFASLGLFFLVTLGIASAITQPLRRLQTLMRQVEEGDLAVRWPEAGYDEVGQLGRGFNRMMTETQNLVTRLADEQRRKNEARLAALQAQINPHFLFNTLSTIRWMATISQAPNVAQLISALARLLQVSMNRDGDFMTVADEVDCAEKYITIQQARYNGSFAVSVEVEPAVQQCQTLRLVLQPLVENAIIHGLAGLPEPGTLAVRARAVDDRLLLEVADTGTGMSAEQVELLLQARDNQARARFSGIGLANVHERLRLHFGPSYGLQIESQEGRGTVVRVWQPLQQR